jgi:eukaryotic-like serine/threonine-protein kinase
MDCASAYLAMRGDDIRERALALLEESRDRLDPILLARVELGKGLIAREKGQLLAYVSHYRRSTAVLESIDLQLNACIALGNLSVALLEVGQLEEAESSIRRVLATGRRMDLKHLVGGSSQILTNILAYRGCLDEARTVGREALSVTRAQNDRRFQGFAEAYLSVTEYLAGNHQQAEQPARAAIATWADVPSDRPFALALLARALLAQGRQHEALANAREAQTALEAMGAVDDGESTIRLALAECVAATGDPCSAQQAVAAAAHWLAACADKIDDPTLRESFLTRIPEHRRIQDLARQFGVRSP